MPANSNAKLNLSAVAVDTTSPDAYKREQKPLIKNNHLWLQTSNRLQW